MTYANIFTKFMIEYDKANVTSSYPSLTEYEIATILDKAYLALIAQKITGNNTRRASIESDIKAIEDLQNLIDRRSLEKYTNKVVHTADNEYLYKLPADILHFMEGIVTLIKSTNSIDKEPHVQQEVTLVTNTVAQKYKASSTNLPWMSNPVCYLESNLLHLLIDSYIQSKEDKAGPLDLSLVFIKKPKLFVDHLNDKNSTTFELNDSVAEELINLAIIMSLEIVESTRLDNKIKTSSLES